MKVEFTIQEEGIWLLKGVRVSFPNLFKPGTYKGALKPRLDTSFLIPIDQMDVIKELNKQLILLARTQASKITKLSQVEYPRLVKSKDGEHYVFSTSNSVEYPPIFFDGDGKEVYDPLASGADRKLYAGCYARIKVGVNATVVEGKVALWSNLTAIQFLAHGERFGGGQSGEDLAKGFEEVADDFEDFGTTKKDDSLKADDDFSDDELEL